jgi:dTMP kinase
MPQPFFLSFDGIDGTGKSTQCRLLVESLKQLGIPVTFAIDPGGTPLGAKLREILLHGKQDSLSARAEALLFMASRAELVDRVIRPALQRGEVVVSDRYLLANVVYQGHAGGMDVADLWSVGQFSTAGVLPDHTLIFDMPVEAAELRRGRSADRLESRAREYHEKVRAGFLKEAELHEQSMTVIDAQPGLEVVQKAVHMVINRLLKQHGWPMFSEASDAVE